MHLLARGEPAGRALRNRLSALRAHDDVLEPLPGIPVMPPEPELTSGVGEFGALAGEKDAEIPVAGKEGEPPPVLENADEGRADLIDLEPDLGGERVTDEALAEVGGVEADGEAPRRAQELCRAPHAARRKRLFGDAERGEREGDGLELEHGFSLGHRAGAELGAGVFAVEKVPRKRLVLDGNVMNLHESRARLKDRAPRHPARAAHDERHLGFEDCPHTCPPPFQNSVLYIYYSIRQLPKK